MTIDICMKVLSCKSVKDVWMKLEEIYGNKESLAKQESVKRSIQVKGISCMAKGKPKNSIINANSLWYFDLR